VYGQPGVTCPAYMLRINHHYLDAKHPHGLGQARRFIPHLQKALRIALEESDRLGDSPLYQHDLIDIARQLLSDLFNLHVARLAARFRAKDIAAFEREAKEVDEILASQQMLLSSSDYFCLAPILAKAKALPGAPEDYDRRIRDVLTVWAGKIPDYAHRDYYELIRFYYRRRVNAFLDHARARFPKQAEIVNYEQLAPTYDRIEQAWVNQPFEVAESEKYAQGPVRAVVDVLDKHGLDGDELSE